MPNSRRLPMVRRALLLVLPPLRSALPLLVTAIAAWTGYPPAELYQLATDALDVLDTLGALASPSPDDAVTGLPSAKASRDAPLQLPAPRRGRPRRRRCRARGRRRGR